jgi:hypothetical protein
LSMKSHSIGRLLITRGRLLGRVPHVRLFGHGIAIPQNFPAEFCKELRPNMPRWNQHHHQQHPARKISPLR